MQTLFLTFKTKPSNLISISKFIHTIKNGKISGFNNTQTKLDENKENLSPNIIFNRSSKKQSFIKKSVNPMIMINCTLTKGWVNINFDQIVAKIKQSK